MPTLTPDQSCIVSVAQVDSSNTPLTTPDPTYGPPTFTNSNPAVIALAGIRGVPTGVLGSSTIVATETSSDSTKAPISGTIVLTVVGPAAAALQLVGQVVDGH